MRKPSYALLRMNQRAIEAETLAATLRARAEAAEAEVKRLRSALEELQEIAAADVNKNAHFGNWAKYVQRVTYNALTKDGA